jgi:hypothetical protein
MANQTEKQIDRREKKTAPVGFRISEETFTDLEAAAWSEHRKRNELARLIFEWGFVRYQEAGSYDALIGRKSSKASK